MELLWHALRNVCKKEYIDTCKAFINKFRVQKVIDVISGGETGQDSIYQGLVAAKTISDGDKDIVLIHDGVRPLITTQTITDNIEKVMKEGSCITCIPATETFVVCQPDGSLKIPSRADSLIARAPQSFYLEDILQAHEQARSEGRHDFIDSCTMMHHYGHQMGKVIGPMENIKITTPTDYFVFKAMVEVHENQQIFGY